VPTWGYWWRRWPWSSAAPRRGPLQRPGRRCAGRVALAGWPTAPGLVMKYNPLKKFETSTIGLHRIGSPKGVQYVLEECLIGLINRNRIML
jgi:hypothetical protein